MKNHLTTLAVAVAAVLGLGANAQAGHNDMHRDMDHSVHRTSTLRADLEHDARETGEWRRSDERPFLARAATFPYRAARTVARTPIIVGETLAGRRQVVSDEGRFIGRGDRYDRIDDRDEDDWNDRDGSFLRRTASLPYRTARSVVRSPIIVGETLAGRRQVVSDEGRFLARGDRDDRIDVRNAGVRTGRMIVRTADRTGDRIESGLERGGRTVARGAERSGRFLARGVNETGGFLARTGRTIARTPVIVGETLSGERRVVDRDARFFSRADRGDRGYAYID